MNRFHTLRVQSVKPETREAIMVTLEVPAAQAELFRFHPGQHLNVRATIETEEVRRSYSLCASPAESEQGGVLRVAIKRVPGGVFSNWANDTLKAGSQLDVMPPSGNFGLSPKVMDALGGAVAGQGRHVLLMGAGSGVTPLLSIARTLLQADDSTRVSFIYGNRSSSNVMFRDELGDLKDVYTRRFNLIHVLSREHQDIDLFNGRLDQARCTALFEQWLDVSDVNAAFICGPVGMMDAAKEALKAKGMAADRIHTELFATSLPKGPRQVQKAVVGNDTCEVTVVQDGRKRQFAMRKNALSVLEAALGEGFELPYSCKGGVCSTCRCKVTAGDVDMDTNYALEDYEIAAGFRLSCQSFPVTDKLTIDFDMET